jgi:hypothetical protein
VLIDKNYEIVGACPLILHNGQLIDPMNPYSKAIKEITGKRKKTEADHEELAKREWLGGLYLKDEKPVIMGLMVKAMLIESAKKNKLGKAFKPAIFINGAFPIVYDGPQDVYELWENPDFRLTCNVKVGQSSIIRTRPKFNVWRLQFAVTIDDEQISVRDVDEALVRAGQIIGLGDWRPQFGRFTVVE